MGGLNHVELPAVLCSWRLIFFHRGDGTAGENFGERSCQGFITGGFSGLFSTLATVSRGRNGDAMHAIWTLPQMMRPIQNAGARLKNISLNPGSHWEARNNPVRHPASHVGDEVSGNATMQNILCAMKEITDGISTTSITTR